MRTFDVLADMHKFTYFCFSPIGIATQATLLLVLFRRRRVVAPGPLEDVPVAYIVLRDGSLYFLAVCGKFRSCATEDALTF